MSSTDCAYFCFLTPFVSACKQMCLLASARLVGGEIVTFGGFPSFKRDEMETEIKYVICRLCLHKSEDLVDIFQVNSSFGYAAAELISDLLRLQAELTDEYPRVICSRCHEKLMDFKVFKEQCISSKHAYTHLYIRKCQEVEDEISQMHQPLVKIEPIDISDDDISSQWSCHSESTHPEEILGNEVSTLQCMKKRREESAEQRERRLERQRNYYNQRKQTETTETRELRLSKMRELATQRRERESAEQRDQRLAQLRMYAMRRIANETPDQRDLRLKNMRLYAENRLANESLEQRQRRLGHAPFDSPEKKASGIQKRKPYVRKSSSSLPEGPAAQGNTFEQLERCYEPQGNFQEYLNQLGLGLVEQRMNQIQGQYPYANPRMFDPHFATLDKYPMPFPQSQIVPFNNTHSSGPQQGVQAFGAHPEVVNSVQKPHLGVPFQPGRPMDSTAGTDMEGRMQQVPQQCPKKPTEAKMYEIL